MYHTVTQGKLRILWRSEELRVKYGVIKIDNCVVYGLFWCKIDLLDGVYRILKVRASPKTNCEVNIVSEFEQRESSTWRNILINIHSNYFYHLRLRGEVVKTSRRLQSWRNLMQIVSTFVLTSVLYGSGVVQKHCCHIRWYHLVAPTAV